MTPQQNLIFYIRYRLSSAKESASDRKVSRQFIPEGETKSIVSPARVAHWHNGGGARIELVIEAAKLVGLEVVLNFAKTKQAVGPQSPWFYETERSATGETICITATHLSGDIVQTGFWPDDGTAEVVIEALVNAQDSNNAVIVDTETGKVI